MDIPAIEKQIADAIDAERKAWAALAALAADRLCECAEREGGEWGPFSEKAWKKDADLINRLREAAGLPPVTLDKWGKITS